MSDRSGCGLVELTGLEALDVAAGGRPRVYARSSAVLDEVEERIGLGPRYGYEALLDLARPWVVPVLLVAAQGSVGDRVFPEPAWPGHTQCRPSRAGRLVLAAEAGRRPAVPVGLINGNAYRDGRRPPLDPFAVLAALRRLLDDPAVADSELTGLVGPPWSGGGCPVTGDLAALAKGRRVVLREDARITRTATPVPPERPAPSPQAGPGHYRVRAGPTTDLHPVHLVIESLPGRTVTSDVAREIAGRASHRERGLPVADVRDESRGAEVRILITLRGGANPDEVRDQIAALRGVWAEAEYAFLAPLGRLLRTWVNEHHDEDVAGGLDELETAIREDRERAVRYFER